MDLGAYGANPGTARGRRPAAAQSSERRNCCGAAPAARSAPARRRCRRDAPTDIRRASPPRTVRPQTPGGGLIDLEFIAQYLMLREAAARPQVLHRAAIDGLAALAAAGVLSRAAADELRRAAGVLHRVLTVLTLVDVGGEWAEPFAEPDATMIARCAGAVDFAELSADISQAAAVVRRWYDRLIEEPAARVQQEAAEQAGDPPA